MRVRERERGGVTSKDFLAFLLVDGVPVHVRF